MVRPSCNVLAGRPGCGGVRTSFAHFALGQSARARVLALVLSGLVLALAGCGGANRVAVASRGRGNAERTTTSRVLRPTTRAGTTTAPAPTTTSVPTQGPVASAPAPRLTGRVDLPIGPEVALGEHHEPVPRGTVPSRHRPRTSRVVLEIGDSLGEDLGWGMPGALTGTHWEFQGEAVGDTGLAQPSYYDWPEHLESLLREYHPGVVVVFMGANDWQSFYYQGRYVAFATKAWAKVYGQRAAELVDEAKAAGARLLWVGMPPMAEPTFTQAMATVDAVYRHVVAGAGSAEAAYLSTTTVLGARSGQYRATMPGRQGPQDLRTPDGTHITVQGAALVARAVVAKLKALGWLAT